MLNNPDLNFTWAMNKYAMGSGSFIMDGDRIYSDYNDDQWAMMDVFNSDYTDFAYSMPTVSLTTEESEAYTPLYNDIDTYISETFLLFINGSKPLDEFDEFVEKIYSLGLDQCLEYEQAAYDRYLER
jgi:putative aldouronate transport system substrate-binding protein